MKTGSINSPEALSEWLEDKPYQWAQAVSSRTALRTFPCLVNSAEDWLTRFALGIMRAGFISWATANLSSLKIDRAGRIASHDVIDAAQAAETFASRTLDHINRVPTSYDDAKMAMNGAVPAQNAATALSFAADIAQHNLKRIEGAGLCFLYANSSFAAAFGTQSEIAAASKDCEWLSKNAANNIAAQVISGRGLWLDAPPVEWSNGYDVLRSRLLMIDPNYSVWIDWYERRIKGEDSGFTIPGDKNRKEDKTVVRKLAKATDEDFWGKGHEYVNATLKGWLDEARARAAANLPPIVAEASGAFGIGGSATAELGPLPTPPQQASAIAYGVNEQGKLDRLPNSDQAHLRDVPNQRRAYNDMREAAAELLAEGQRLGHRLQRALDRFRHSLPDGFEDAEAYLVWRDANALRRIHRAHREASKSPEPDAARLEPVVAEGLGGLLDLYNNFAFADDGLRAKDEARVAPQELASAEAEAKAASPLVEAILTNPEIATPEALDDILADEENAELPADDPYAAQVLQQSNESRKNFLAAALAWGAKALASPKQVGKAVAIGSVTGAAGVVGKVAMTAIIGTDYGPLLPFIAANAEILQRYVAIAFPSFEHLPSLIDQLKLLWARLRH